MKIELEIRECKDNEAYLHQSGFTLNDGENVDVNFCTTVPGGFPYIFIETGKNKGKRFIIDGIECQKLCEYLINA